MHFIKLYRIWVGHDFWPSLSTLIFGIIAVEIAIDYNSNVIDLLNMKSLYGMLIIISPMHTHGVKFRLPRSQHYNPMFVRTALWNLSVLLTVNTACA